MPRLKCCQSGTSLEIRDQIFEKYRLKNGADFYIMPRNGVEPLSSYQKFATQKDRQQIKRTSSISLLPFASLANRANTPLLIREPLPSEIIAKALRTWLEFLLTRNDRLRGFVLVREA